MPQRREKVSNLVKKLCAEFLQREAGNQSLITITDCNISPDLKNATIFISVLPESSEKFALNFVKRKLKEMRQHIKKNTNMRVLPFIEAKIDLGEKNRQLIDELSRNQ